jgi:hypothetical protein
MDGSWMLSHLLETVELYRICPYRSKTIRLPGRPLSRHHLREIRGPTSGPPAAATNLGFARFFFPLFQSMLRMGSNPTIWQQGFHGGGVGGCRPS